MKVGISFVVINVLCCSALAALGLVVYGPQLALMLPKFVSHFEGQGEYIFWTFGKLLLAFNAMLCVAKLASGPSTIEIHAPVAINSKPCCLPNQRFPTN